MQPPPPVVVKAAAGLCMCLLVIGTLASAAAAASAPAKSGPNWPVTKCAMSEFTCTNGKCVQLNKFCDNTNDCGDGSDEPRFCTRKFSRSLHPIVRTFNIAIVHTFTNTRTHTQDFLLHISSGFKW